jgi:hypothetical protein
MSLRNVGIILREPKPCKFSHLLNFAAFPLDREHFLTYTFLSHILRISPRYFLRVADAKEVEAKAGIFQGGGYIVIPPMLILTVFSVENEVKG